MASKQSPTLFRNRIPLWSQTGVRILIKTRSHVVSNWGQNFDQNGVLFWTELGVWIFMKMRSHVGSNLGSEFWPKRGPVSDQTWGQTFDQNESPLWIKAGGKFLTKMRSRFGPNLWSESWPKWDPVLSQSWGRGRSEWDPVFAHAAGHGSCLRWVTAFTKPFKNIGKDSLSWKAWLRNGVETKSNVVQKSDPTLITTEVGILIKTRSRVVWTLGSEFWPKRGPFLDQAWGQNLYQNEIPFCIKRGVRILIEMRYRFGSN